VGGGGANYPQNATKVSIHSQTFFLHISLSIKLMMMTLLGV